MASLTRSIMPSASACKPRAPRLAVSCRASMSPFERVGLTAAAVACTIGLAASPAMAAASRRVQLTVDGNESPVHVTMGIDGSMKIKPASEGLQAKTGHFHILIDTDGSVGETEAIPFDDAHRHYGKGQTSDDIVLTPGKHTLTLQFANALHESYGPKYATSVVVDIKQAAAPAVAAE